MGFALPRYGNPKTLTQLEAGGMFFLDHRGSALNFPEQTMEAYRGCAALGSDMLECDAHLLLDGSLGLMHDATLDRTTTSSGATAAQSAVSWKRLVVDSSVFLGAGWPDTRPPLLTELLTEFGNNIVLSIEAKNAGSGAAIVAALQRYGIRKDMAVVNSDLAGELTPAVAAGYPTNRGVGTYVGTPTPVALKAAGNRWVALNSLTSIAQIDALRAAGLKVAVATINDRAALVPFIGHCDAVFSDDAAYLSGRLPRRLTDPFALQTWFPGHQASTSAFGENGGRGSFTAPNQWGIDLTGGNNWGGALMGWAGKIGGVDTLPSVVIDWTVQLDTAINATRTAWMALKPTDKPFNTDSGTNADGYTFTIGKDGTVGIYKFKTGVAGGALLGSSPSSAIADGGTATCRLTVTPTSLKMERVDVPASVTVTDTEFRGPYLHAGCKGMRVRYSGITISGVPT